MYTEKLASIWKFYGAVHPSIAETLNSIAAVHDKQGNYHEAILGEFTLFKSGVLLIFGRLCKRWSRCRLFALCSCDIQSRTSKSTNCMYQR